MKTLKSPRFKFPGAVCLDEKLGSNLQDIAYCLELAKVNFRCKALILHALLTRQTSEPGWTIAPVDTVCLMSTNVLLRRELKAIELVWEGVAEVTATYLHSVGGQ